MKFESSGEKRAKKTNYNIRYSRYLERERERWRNNEEGAETQGEAVAGDDDGGGGEKGEDRFIVEVY